MQGSARRFHFKKEDERWSPSCRAREPIREGWTARLHIPGVLDTQLEPIKNKVTGALHRTRIALSFGKEFTLAEVASGSTRATGKVHQLDSQGVAQDPRGRTLIVPIPRAVCGPSARTYEIGVTRSCWRAARITPTEEPPNIAAITSPITMSGHAMPVTPTTKRSI